MNAPFPPTSRAPAIPDLSAFQAAALGRFARDFEKSKRDGVKRIEAVDELSAVRLRIDLRQYAVIEMVAGRGVTIAQLVMRTGSPANYLADLLRKGATSLARHYERRAAEQVGG